MSEAKPTVRADYENGAATLRPFYRHDPHHPDLEQMLADRRTLPVDRELLVAALLEQNQELPNADRSIENIRALASSSTFTVTTGHQLASWAGRCIRCSRS